MAGDKNRKLKAKIINVEADPVRKGRTIVSVRFDDGDSAGPWVQGFSIMPDRPVSLEEFILLLKDHPIVRPVDSLQYLKVAQDQEFELDLPEQA